VSARVEKPNVVVREEVRIWNGNLDRF